MYNEVITLNKVQYKTDGTEKTVSRDVFCRIASIGTNEFYQAHSAGLKPDIKFVIADYEDYEGESILTYNQATYTILRTYRVDNELEITCQAEIGGGY